MIDLGALVAKIVVDGGDSLSQLQDFGNQAENAEGKSFKLTDGLKKLASGFAIGVAIKKTADALIGCAKAADELNSAANTLQTQTGATDEEMAGLEETLKSIYANNYGEDFEDIAVSLAEVKNQTGLADEALQNATESAIALRDTFGFEVQESTRAADMMMKQFGVTSDEAFNLIAQGAQGGLDKNGNILDSINEYSVHFQQLGFDAEDMFNMFSNGAQSGVFDIDKLGDAVKEFGIRAKDGSNTTIEAFELLGFNAEEMQTKFAAGGESANEAFKEITEALNNCDDEVVKNTAGVNLFGTMWEDMGAEAVAALSNTNGKISKTSNALDDIKAIKYDDMKSAFEGIGRQIEAGLVIPIGEQLLPLLNWFANWINAHMPEIQAVFERVIGVIEALIIELDPVFDTALSLITDIFHIFAAAFSGDWETFWEEIEVFFTDIVWGLERLLSVALDALILVFTGMVDSIKGAATALFEKIEQAFAEVWARIETWFSDKLEALKNSITKKVNDFKNAGKKIMTAVWDGMKSIWNNIMSWVHEKAEAIKDTLAFWRDSEPDADGSHRTGLSYVPYDEYKAILHKGEMVLTQPEAEKYRNGKNDNESNGDFIINIGTVQNSSDRSVQDFLREVEYYRKARLQATGGE